MIYYNLNSEYPGDVTKHCGLTIDEVDRNFYELETKINSFDPYASFKRKTFWGYSSAYDYPELNSVEISMIDDNTCFVSGVIKNGKAIFGIDTMALFGVAPTIYGEGFINGVQIPKSFIIPCNMTRQGSFGIKTRISVYGDELLLLVDGPKSSSVPIEIPTNNRRLNLSYKYNGETIVSGGFVFDENITVEEFKPSLWYDKTIWYDDDIWTTNS